MHPYDTAPGTSNASAYINELNAAYLLKDITLARFRFSLIALQRVVFNQPPTSTLWSALGRALYNLDTSLYYRLFKPGLDVGGVQSPFVLATSMPYRDTYQPGEEFSFDLTLTGWATAHLGDFVQATLLLENQERSEDYGLGTGRTSGQGSVYLSRVMALDEEGQGILLLERGDAAYFPVPRTLTVDAIKHAATFLPGRAATIQFLTPTFLKKKSQRVKEPRFDHLITRLGWRVRELMRLHNDTTPDFRPLVKQAQQVHTFDFDIQDAEGHRFSRRRLEQENLPTIPLHGFTGTLTIYGDLTPYRPLLTIGQWLHVGKNTERGLGQFRVEPARLPDYMIPA